MAVTNEVNVSTNNATVTTTTNINTTNSNSNNATVEKPKEHLLEHKWVLWYRPPANHTNSTPKANQWEHSQRKLFEANTVEEYWTGFHKVPRITSAHQLNCDYSLFRDGIKPMWEDEFNKFGGRWTANIERRNSRNSGASMPNVIEQVWLDVMLCLIGEGFDPYGDKIAGGVCGIRHAKQGNRSSDMMAAKIHIWTKDANDAEANMKIGEILKSVVQAAEGQLTYSPHDVNGGKSTRNSGMLRL